MYPLSACLSFVLAACHICYSPFTKTKNASVSAAVLGALLPLAVLFPCYSSPVHPRVELPTRGKVPTVETGPEVVQQLIIYGIMKRIVLYSLLFDGLWLA